MQLAAKSQGPFGVFPMLGGGLVGASAPPSKQGVQLLSLHPRSSCEQAGQGLLAHLAGRAPFGQAVASVGYLLPTRRQGGKQPDPSPPWKDLSPCHNPVRASAEQRPGLSLPVGQRGFEGSLKGAPSPAGARGRLSKHAPLPRPCDLEKIPF